MRLTTRRDLITRAIATGTAFGSASVPVIAHANGAGSPIDDLSHVDPDLRAIFKAIKKVPSRPFDLAAERRASLQTPKFKDEPPVTETLVTVGGGAPDVRVYLINGKRDAAPKPAVLYLHGGGFVGGSAKTNVTALQTLAKRLNVVIASVDYRLAPETRFPGALNDNYAALNWLYRNAVDIGVDAQRIAIMGESAGGGHAAMLAISVRDRGEIPLKLQMLIYPMLDDRTGSSQQVPSMQGEVIWTPKQNVFGWQSLLGIKPGGKAAPYGSVPSRIDDLKGLAPAFIAVGTLDLFMNEDVEYAQRLANAGVATELYVVPGAFHGFELAAPKSKIASIFTSVKEAALCRALQIPIPPK